MPQVYTIYRPLSSRNFRKIFFPVFCHFSHVDTAIVPSNSIRSFISDSGLFKHFTKNNSEMTETFALFSDTVQHFIITDPQANIPRLIVCVTVIASVRTHASLSLSCIRHSTIQYRLMQGLNLNLTRL